VDGILVLDRICKLLEVGVLKVDVFYIKIITA
jgi:hypothetical protein